MRGKNLGRFAASIYGRSTSGDLLTPLYGVVHILSEILCVGGCEGEEQGTCTPPNSMTEMAGKEYWETEAYRYCTSYGRPEDSHTHSYHSWP